MPRTLRFHLDENCPHAIADGLRRRGIDVTTTPDVSLISASDEEQTAYALDEGRVIFTLDKDFLRLDASGVPHASIVYCRQGKRGIGSIIQGLTEVWEVMEPQEMQNWLVYL
jgi:predicted nuclease of predicted toxin-antitoxin system